MRYDDVAALEPEAVRCPYAALAELREAGPVFNEQANAWVVSRPDDVAAVCKDYATFSSRNAIGAPPFPPEAEIAKYVPLLLLSDPPRHGQVRKLVQRAFTPGRLAPYEDAIRDLCRRIIADLRASESVDAVRYAEALPIRVILILLGIDDEHLDEFRKYSEELASRVGHDGADPAEQMRIAKEFIGHVAPLLDEAGGEDEGSERSILQTIANAVRTGGLDRHDGARFVLELILAGNVTTSHHIANSLLLLAQDPALAERLRAEPEQLKEFVEESLRVESPVQGLFRMTTREATLAGVTIPEGARVLVHYGAANRDEGLFPDAEVVDLERRSGNKHVAFGFGMHTCLGNMVARLEGRVAIDEWLSATKAFELAVPVDEVAYQPSFANRGPAAVPLKVTWA